MMDMISNQSLNMIMIIIIFVNGGMCICAFAIMKAQDLET